MTGETFTYHDGSVRCEGYVAGAVAGERRPAVLIAHTIAGVSEHERNAAERFAGLGYIGFAIDVYGAEARAGSEDMRSLMQIYTADRDLLLRRLQAALEAARKHPAIDALRIAFIGFCFGGLCALDVARSGTSEVRGVVSLHGSLTPPPRTADNIRAKVLVLHGWADPHVPPTDVLALTKDLTDAGADWQLVAYGNTMHGFTKKGANSPERGVMYNAEADRRSWRATVDFLAEIFARR